MSGFIFLGVLTAAVLALLLYQYWKNPFAFSLLYRCVEDGENSALYIHRARYWSFAGGFRVDLFRRVTCSPTGSANYSTAVSDWFDPYCGYSQKNLMNFEVITNPDKLQSMLKVQIPYTRLVAKKLKIEAKMAEIKDTARKGSWK